MNDIPIPPDLKPVHRGRWAADAPPLVSVAVTTYNHELYIAHCLESILRQKTDFPIEVIIRDDASLDRTAAIIRAYAEKFPQIIKPIYETENQHSLGRKFRPLFHTMAKGRFLAGCDGDDFWTDPLKLVKQTRFLEASPEYVLSFHDAMHIDAKQQRVIKAANLPKQAQRDYTAEELRILKWGWMLTGTMMYRNVPMDFPPEYALIPNGDNFLPMLLGAFGGAKFQPEVRPLAYRKHAQSMWTGQPQQEKIRMHLQSYLQIAGYFVRIGETESAKAILRGRLHEDITRFLQATPPPPTRSPIADE
jgi:glycosyltransferase involved in cell wall biosynthesis